MRIAGHALYFDGAPYRLSSGKWLRWNKDRGGHGMCHCGAVSAFETTNRARKAWHNRHVRIESGELTEEWTPARVMSALRNSYSGVIEAKVRPDAKQGRVLVTIAWDDLQRLVDDAVREWPLEDPDIQEALIRYLKHAEQLAGIARPFESSNVSGRA